jgi:hypothetical protein
MIILFYRSNLGGKVSSQHSSTAIHKYSKSRHASHLTNHKRKQIANTFSNKAKRTQGTGCVSLDSQGQFLFIWLLAEDLNLEPSDLESDINQLSGSMHSSD